VRTKQGPEMALRVLEKSWEIRSKVDRFFACVCALKVLVQFSVVKGVQEVAIFELFNEEWFLSVWAGEEGQAGRKEELCLALMEACLSLRVKQTRWLEMAIQVAEIGSKCLDWEAVDQALNLEVCMNYFLFVEQIAKLSFRSGERDGSQLRLDHLITQIANRLSSVVEEGHDVKTQRRESLFLKQVKASAVLFLAKHAHDQHSALLTTLHAALNHISTQKHCAVDSEQGTILYLNSLFHLARRFPFARNNVLTFLAEFHHNFELLSKKVVREDDIRTLDSLLDLTKTILKMLEQPETATAMQNSFLI